MIKPIIKIIHRLRVYFFIFILVAFFYQIGVQPIELGKFIGARFSSAVGVSTSVPENPFNKLALQLKEKKQGLDEREDNLNNWEELLNKKTNQNDTIIFIVISIGIVVLFFLIAINFYLDRKRSGRK